MTGTITAIKREKGFGFIKDSEGASRFFHANHLEDADFKDLQEGQTVEFEPYIEEGKGARARQIKVNL